MRTRSAGNGVSLISVPRLRLRTRGWMIAGGANEMLKNRIAESIFDRHFNQRG